MDNFSKLNRCNLNIDFPIPDKENKTFQTIFTFIRKKLQIKASRKIILTVFLKKVKENFLEQFTKELNYVLI